VLLKALFAPLIVTLVTVGSGSAEPSSPPLPEKEILSRYVTASRTQQTALRGGTMEVDIDADVPKLRKQGKLHAFRNISTVGRITYRMIGFSGDNTVKKEVIARYLSAEMQAQTGPSLSITPDNYKFKWKGVRQVGGREIYVFHVSPREKKVGLFQGELWLDASTCMPVRESGRFVKNPSIFLKSMDFVRVYEITEGIAVPQRLESRVATRLFGPVVLNINFSRFSKDTETEDAAVAASTNDSSQ
jgi:hypothetical protein